MKNRTYVIVKNMAQNSYGCILFMKTGVEQCHKVKGRNRINLQRRTVWATRYLMNSNVVQNEFSNVSKPIQVRTCSECIYSVLT